MSENEVILVGREAERLRFQEVANELLRTDERGEQRPLVMLMWGLGGIGKTTLTKIFLDIARTMPPFERDVQVTRLDWEVERHSNHRLSGEPHHLDAEQVMEAITRHFDPDGKKKLFQRYQTVKKERVQAEKKVEAQLIPAGHQTLTPLRSLTVKGVAQLMRVYSLFQQVPLGTVAADALEKHGEEAILSALTYLKQRVGEETAALVAEPHGHLARALGLGLRELAKRKPLIFIQDTYEIVEAADPILREAILASGPRVLWVIAGRTNLAANDAGRRFVGYNSLADRLRLRNLPEIGEFSLGDVEGFFADAVPERPLPAGGAARVHAATLGVALAVQLAAEVWRRTGVLAEIEGGGGKGRDEIVREMSERFLVHCTDEAEKKQLYALALLRRPHPPLFQALCGETGREAAHVLGTLARRYPFLFAADNWLHDKVRAFFHEHLLRDAVQRDAVRTLNERGWRWSLSELEQRGQGRTWEARLDSERWVDIALDYLHHLFWSDVDEGWKALPAFFLAGSAYDANFAGSVAEIAREMETSDSRKRQQQLASLDALLQPASNSSDVQAGIKLLRKFWGYPDTLHREEPELNTILVWVEATAPLAHSDDDARDVGQRLLTLLPTVDESWEGLRARVGEGLAEAGRRILWPHKSVYARITPDAAPYMEAALKCRDWSVSARFWNSYGEAMRVSARYAEAVAAFKRVIALQPDHAPGHSNLGNALKDKGELGEAIAAYERAIALQPDYTPAYNNLGNALKAQGKLDEAMAAHQRAIALQPDFAPAHSNLGNAFQEQGKLDEAIAAHQRAIALQPDFAPAHSNLGNALKEQGKLDEAVAAHQRAIALQPDFASAHSNLGNALKEQGKLDEAIAAHQRAIALQPDFASAYNNLGNARRAQGNLDEAIAAYQRAIVLQPDYALAYSNLGNALYEQGNLFEAVAVYQQAIVLQPDYALAYSNLGNALYEQGKLDEAVTAYRKAITLQTDDPDAHGALGHILYDQGQFDAALASCEAALKINPQSSTHHLVGILYWTKEQPDVALKSFERLLTIQPASEASLHGLGKLQRQLGLWDEAEASHRKGLAIKPTSYNWIALADLAKRRGDTVLYQEAIAQAHSLMGDDNNELYFSLCLASVEGRIDEALALLKQAVDKWIGHRAWARQDPDLEWIRDDPRFWEIVGKEDQ